MKFIALILLILFITSCASLGKPYIAVERDPRDGNTKYMAGWSFPLDSK